MSYILRLILVPSVLVVSLMLTAVACGGADTPTAVDPTAADTATSAPAALAAPAADPTATATPPPAATIRPTNTPAPTAAARAAPAPLPSGAPKYGGTVRMAAYADTRDWDPLGSASLSSVISYSQHYNQLVQFDTVDTNAVAPDLAESWEINDDGTIYTFHITDGVMWNDGTPLTVDDVLYSMLRYGNPCNGAGRSGLWRTYVVPLQVVDRDARDCTVTNADDAIRVVDDKTIEFRLAFASGAFIKFLAIDYVKVLPKHLLEQGIDLNQAENILEHNSGSGPFILEQYQSGNFYNVNRNPDYFKEGLPYFDRIEHYIITVPSTGQAQIEARQIDMANAAESNFTATEYFALEQRTNSDYVAHDIAGGATRGLMLNIKREPFNNHLVRQAINLAVDR